MTTLTDAKRDEFLSKLTIDKEELITTISTLKQRLSEAESEKNLTDEGDISQNLELRSTTLTEINHKEQRLREVTRAIHNFEDDFGYCVVCGVDIPVERLNFNPAVTTCVNCQTTIEKKRRIG